MYAKCSKGQRLAGLCVDQQDFSIQDHTVTSGKRLRDVVLKVCHLKHYIKALNTENKTGSKTA